jgi:hypothetical protein
MTGRPPPWPDGASRPRGRRSLVRHIELAQRARRPRERTLCLTWGIALSGVEGQQFSRPETAHGSQHRPEQRIRAALTSL